MKNAVRLCSSLAVALMLSFPIFAQEFSAEVISRAADDKVSRSKLYEIPEKERFNSTVELKAGRTIDTHMVVDRREKLIYILEPQQKTILVNHVLQLAGNSSATGATSINPCEDLMQMINPIVVKQQCACKQIGHESVNGRTAENGKWNRSGLATALHSCGWILKLRQPSNGPWPTAAQGSFRTSKLGPSPPACFCSPRTIASRICRTDRCSLG